MNLTKNRKYIIAIGIITTILNMGIAVANESAPAMEVWHDSLLQPVSSQNVIVEITQTPESAVAPTPEPIPLGEQAVEIAKQYIGVPYLWGGTTPDGFDCSGLMQYVYKQLGISISRTTATQIKDGRAVSRDELKEGDLILFGNPVHHVGMYVGNGSFIEAPYSGERVRIVPLSSRNDYNCVRRIVE